MNYLTSDEMRLLEALPNAEEALLDLFGGTWSKINHETGEVSVGYGYLARSEIEEFLTYVGIAI